MQPPPPNQARGYSLIQDRGHYNSRCGYCKDEEETSRSTGMHAHRLTVYDYQELLDQGWRRSGKFLYKPDNQRTCCRQYTIRLDVTDFQPTRAHRKLMRKWEQYLAGTLHQHPQQQPTTTSNSPDTAQDMQTDAPTVSTKRARKADEATTGSMQQQQQQPATGLQLLEQVRCLLQAAVSQLHQQQQQQQDGSGGQVLTSDVVSTQLLPAVKVILAGQQQQQQSKQQQSKQTKQVWPPGTVCTSACAHAIAAAARKHTSRQQQQPQQQSPQAAPSGPGSVDSSSMWCQAEALASSLAAEFNSLAAGAAGGAGVGAGAAQQLAQGLTAVASKGHINFIQQQEGPQATTIVQQQGGSNTKQQQQQVQTQGQQGQPQQGEQQQKQDGGVQQQQQQQQQPQSPRQLEVRMVPNQFIQEEFELWQRYQVQQHHESLSDLTPRHYRGFLVDTPLIHVPQMNPAPAAGGGAAAAAGGPAGAGAAVGSLSGPPPSCGYGSFHQQYWLDGKLVAVGVVDVLPRCLSSKYFFWDPDYAWLSLGRYGALREISWVAEQQAAGAVDLRYYYLGYYIHTCPKMAYKAEYPPSELLCPKRQVWCGYGDAIRQALDRAPYVVLSDLPGVQTMPNLSVPRSLPPPPLPQQQQAAAGAAAGGGVGELGGAAAGGGLSVEQQILQRQQERAALDAQTLLLMETKQPVRWGVLRDSGMLPDEFIELVEDSLASWRAAVGETARTLMYALGHEL